MRFRCFGTWCQVIIPGDEAGERRARARLLDWHDRFSRFRPDSELSRVNADPRPALPVSREMARLVGAVVFAGELTGGLADGTLLSQIEDAGYRGDLGPGLPLQLAVRLAPERRPGGPSAAAAWRSLQMANGVLRRPPGVRIDSGGLAKGLFADLLAIELAERDEFAIDCGGDLRFAGRERTIEIADPFGGAPVAALRLSRGALATSGIGRRSWLGTDGHVAHHLLDPATGRPAFTGVVQATAVAPTALEAEARAKAALLAGPDNAAGWLPLGGVVVFDDGSHAVIEPSAEALAA
jgi:FAD:protein FMN transferase